MMSIKDEIENIIYKAIYITKDNILWENYKINIISNLNQINFNYEIENYQPCYRRLYITRPRMREILYHYICLNKNLFFEVNYGSYRPKEESNIMYGEIYDFIEECIKILVKKQQSNN